MIVFEPVQAAIWHCLNHYAYSDAVFLAERLHAEVESDDSLFLLATSYYRWGKPLQAYSILKDKPCIVRHPQCRYLLARCANDLHRHAEAEKVISGTTAVPSQINLDQIAVEFGDQASFALQLLARIFAKSERIQSASETFLKALKLNPFLWSCYVELCNLGEKPDPAQLFQLTNLTSFATCHGSTLGGGVEMTCGVTTPDNGNLRANFITPCAPVSKQRLLNSTPLDGTSIVQFGMVRTLMFGTLDCDNLTPTFGCAPLDTSTPYAENNLTTPGSGVGALTEANQDQKSLAKRVRQHVGQLMSRRETGTATTNVPATPVAPLHINKPVLSSSSNISMSTPVSSNVPNVRRSSRLFSNSNSVKENNKSPNRDSKFVTPKSPSRKTKQRMAKANLNKSSFNEIHVKNLQVDLEKESSTITTSHQLTNLVTKNNNQNQQQNHQQITPMNITQTNQHSQIVSLQKQCAEGLMELLRALGSAYQQLAQFNCRRAIELLQRLPPHHYNTSWVLSMRALAHFELNEYDQAAAYFKEIHEREPYRLDLMEIYSTALWHLQREVELSALAQTLQAMDRDSPVTWCVAGNCFSLQKEHDTAIKLFERAVQIDPTFTYAYNLLGHEYVTTEEMDKAMACFRSAIRLDPRHYKAWFGIATVYSKQELFTLAEYHFKRALVINPHSSVILCHVGVVQHARKKTNQALDTLNTAIAADPHNPLAKFHRASVYFAAGRHAEALDELEQLKNTVPKESLVYYLIGKIHKKLGNTHLALMYFSWATDLDPKGASNQIKEAFEPALGRSSTESGGDEEETSTSGTAAPASSTRNGSLPSDANGGVDSLQVLPDSDDSL